MTRSVVKSVLAGVCALALLWPLPGRAQRIVYDPTNYAQNLLQAARALEHVRNQITQIEQAAAMLRQNPLQLSSEISDQINEARSLFETAEGIAFEIDELGEDLRTLYPETWQDFDLESVLAQSERWEAESRQSLERAMAAEARASRSIEQSRGRITRALASSVASEGQTGAIQAGNQLLGVTAAQLAEIHTLLIAQGRALETERLERMSRDQRAREIQRRAFPTSAAATSAPAERAF